MKKFLNSWAGPTCAIIAGFFVVLTGGQLFGADWLVNFANWLPIWGTGAATP